MRLEGKITAETPAVVRDWLNTRKRGPASVVIDSTGGSASAAFDIVEQFRRHGRVYGYAIRAESAGLIVLLGCKRRFARTDTVLMHHAIRGAPPHVLARCETAYAEIWRRAGAEQPEYERFERYLPVDEAIVRGVITDVWR